MKALQFLGLHRAELADIPEPSPAAGEVVVRVDAVGICHTDLEILRGNYPAIFPVVPGHEFAGEVVAMGSGVADSWMHRQVAVDPLVTCGSCAWCLAGRRNLCASMRAYGSELDGGLAEYVAVREQNLEDASALSPEVAALAEPLACAENGALRAGIRAADEVLVVGAGPIGLLIMTAFGARGATVTVAEPQAERRNTARSFGSAAEHQSADAALAARGGEPFDVVVDVTGRPDVVQDAYPAVRKGGRFLLFGVCPPKSEFVLDPYDVYKREITVLGSFSLNGTLPNAVATLRGSKVPFDDLITHRIGLGDLPSALELPGRPGVLKVQVDPRKR
jgi:2-desacetyl-2-hydroxyethyl bacteriochlorophyllide A dehydrogenase